jgi:hypothetical protein
MSNLPRDRTGWSILTLVILALLLLATSIAKCNTTTPLQTGRCVRKIIDTVTTLNHSEIASVDTDTTLLDTPIVAIKSSKKDLKKNQKGLIVDCIIFLVLFPLVFFMGYKGLVELKEIKNQMIECGRGQYDNTHKILMIFSETVCFMMLLIGVLGFIADATVLIIVVFKL